MGALLIHPPNNIMFKELFPLVYRCLKEEWDNHYPLVYFLITSSLLSIAATLIMWALSPFHDGTKMDPLGIVVLAVWIYLALRFFRRACIMWIERQKKRYGRPYPPWRYPY